MRSKDASRYARFLESERQASHLYRALAQLVDGERREALVELATIEDRHAAHWEKLLREGGFDVPADQGPSVEDQAIIARARTLSLDAVLPQLESAEREAEDAYDDEPAALSGMAGDERVHAETLAALADRSGPHAVVDGGDHVGGDASGGRGYVAGATPGEVRASLNAAEHWHRTDRSGSWRAAVFGASDGLVSNTALVMGFAGAGSAVSSGTVLFAGVAGLLAGAFSMAAGEYVSVASQRDLYAREIAIEARELETKPEEERQELELIYRAKGMDRESAKAAAEQIMADPKIALDTLAREELGLNPDDLGSPVKAASASFAAFTAGATVPVVPYLFWSGAQALFVAIALAVLALVAVGGTVGRLSGAGVVKSAARQLAVGGGAAAVTFVVGHLVGAVV